MINNKKYFSNKYDVENNKHFLSKILLFILSIVIVILIFLTLGYSLNNKIVISRENITVPKLSKNIEGYTILHISDLFGNKDILSNNELLNLLKFKKFNSVCLTGNMIGDSKNIDAMFDLINQIKQLNEKANIYYLPGDFDPPTIKYENDNQDIRNEYIIQLEQRGVIFLDRPYYEQIGKNRIWYSPEYLYSIDPKATLSALTSEIESIENSNDISSSASIANKTLSYRSRIMELAIDAKKTITENDVQVILSTLPLDTEMVSETIRFTDSDDIYSLRKAHLVLSGSLVGGQWCLPGRQPIYVPNYGIFPKKEDISGKSRILTLHQYINPGLSCSPIYPFLKIRIYNPPTISLLKIKSEY